MKRLFLCAASVLLIGGCPAQQVDGPDQRLEPNDHLRAMCPQLTDNEMRFFLEGIESDRMAGYGFDYELAANLNICENMGCTTCMSALVRQVYDQP